MIRRTTIYTFWFLLILATFLLFIDEYRYTGTGILFLVLPGLLVLNLSINYKHIISQKWATLFVLLSAIINPIILIIHSVFITLHIPGGVEMTIVSAISISLTALFGGLYIWSSKGIPVYLLVLLVFPAIIIGTRIIPTNFPKAISDDYPRYVMSLYWMNKTTLNRYRECSDLGPLRHFEEKIIALGGGISQDSILIGFYKKHDIQPLIDEYEQILKNHSIDANVLKSHNFIGEMLLNISQIEIQFANTNCK